MHSKLAPVVVFAFRRADHLRKTLTSLSRCIDSAKTDVVIFIDGAKTDAQIRDVENTFAVANCAYGFKSCTVHLREENLGLKRNIIEGVSTVLSRNDKVIVLEDDITCSKDFLVYMNKFLNLYEKTNRVWHINGWNYNCQFKSNDEYYFSRIMNCWGWATWKDRWENLELDPELACKSLGYFEKQRFNCNWTFPFFSQLLGNAIGVNDTWAIYWYYSIFKHKGLCLSPKYTKSYNIGNDGTGTHSAIQQEYLNEEDFVLVDWSSVQTKFLLQESKMHLKELETYFRQLFGLKRRLIGIIKALLPFRLSRLMFGRKS